MSDYVREKVLRIPALVIGMTDEDFERLEEEKPELFGWSVRGRFGRAPTSKLFLDYVLDCDDDGFGEFAKIRELSDSEKKKYLPKFQSAIPGFSPENMDFVKLVEFCWYNCSEAPDYYEQADDPFYDEI